MTGTAVGTCFETELTHEGQEPEAEYPRDLE